jgi:N-methylhydantoinase A
MDPLYVGVDIGGTFTDFIATSGTRLLTAKIPSTPSDPALAMLQGLQQLLQENDLELSDVKRLAHGTTVATNAMIEHRGGRVAFLTTRGFEDVIEIGRMSRSNIYDLHLSAETPVFIAPRRFRIGIPERLAPDGTIITALDETAVEAAVETMVTDHGVTAFAVGYLFSYCNPVHEQRTRDIIRAKYPNVLVSISSEVNPQFREYERFSTTLIDAYLRPPVAAYLNRVAEHLKIDENQKFFIMQSSGGLCSANQALQNAVTLLKSGLAAGVVGACEIAIEAGYRDIISVDIGGTSCDVALVTDGTPITRSENTFQTFPIRVPMIDVNTVGAGGGSIAWLDDAGGLHVGPQSAGAMPGPACYGRGGTQPTVTDASVVLGYLNPSFFAGGKLKLDRERAINSLKSIADSLGLKLDAMASGIHRIVNAAMTNEIRKVSLQRGHDPRKFALVLLGGAGPLHGAELARDLDITTLIIPLIPGLLAAQGLLFAKITHNETVPLRRGLKTLSRAELLAQCQELDRRGRAFLAEDGIRDDITVQYTGHMRYSGQSFELDVVIPPLDSETCVEALRKRFDDMHRRIYGRENSDREVELIGLSATQIGDQPRPPAFQVPPASRLSDAFLGKRHAYFATSGSYVEAAVYDRSKLSIGVRFQGPAIVEQLDTTTIVPPDASVYVHRSGALIMTLGESKS